MTQRLGSNDADSHLSQQSDTASEESGGPNSRTPLYRASNAPRYQRQDIISRIQERTGRRLIPIHCDVTMFCGAKLDGFPLS